MEDFLAKYLMEEISRLERNLIIQSMVLPSRVHVPFLAMVLVEDLTCDAVKVCNFSLTAKTIPFKFVLLHVFLSLLVHPEIRQRLPFT